MKRLVPLLITCSLWRAFASGAEDLPVTVAGPGFVVEALTVTTMTAYYFPEGEKYLKTDQPIHQLGLLETGMVVRAKLFAPPGRTLHSVTGVRVIKATDDKGRIVAQAQGEPSSAEAPLKVGGAKKVTSMPLLLRLQLPPPDAQSIDELAAEAIALTSGRWKELTLTNVQENGSNAIDLAALLPGATMVVTKLDTKNGQVRIEARIQGPAAIRQLDFQPPFFGVENWYCQVSDRGSSKNDASAPRNLTMQSYSYGADGAEITGPLRLVVRYPEDQRRERVLFRFTALDLF